MDGTAIDQALAAIRANRAEQQAARATAMEAVKAIDVEIRKLNVAEKALDPTAAAPRRAASVDNAREVMARLGTATQMVVAREMDVPKNTAKTALEKLEAEGAVKRTGKSVSRSPEFEYVADAA